MWCSADHRINNSYHENHLRHNANESYSCLYHRRAKLKKLETLSNEELSEDFLNDSHKFTQFVYDRCPPMTMPDGADITGSS